MKKNLEIIKETVLSMGGTIDEFFPERNCFYVNVLGKRILLERKISITRNSFVSGKFTSCKDITHKLLLSHGLPSPRSEFFYKKTFVVGKAKKQLENLKYPIVVKDSNGSNSIGVFPFILNKAEALKLLQAKLGHYHSMIAQEMVFGKEYRILVLGEKVIAALQMVPPYVTGDGTSSLKKLIFEKQKKTARRTKEDEKLKEIFKDQKVSMRSIIPNGKVIYLKKSSCLAEGGETKDVTGLVNEEIRKICVAASKVVGKYLVGIDIMCQDVSKFPAKNSFYILEINGKPDLYIHYSPTHGEPRNVVKDIIRFMARLAIPIQKK